MSRQLTLNVTAPRADLAALLIPTAGTFLARQVLSGEVAPPSPVACLHGPAGSGKTLLLQSWLAQHPADDVLAIDDLDTLTPVQQTDFFHAYNRIASNAAPGLLIVTASRGLVADLPLLPDLKSRLLLGLQIAVEPPTQDELAHLALKWAAERQLVLPPDVIQYLLTRAERNAPSLHTLIQRLDALSLEQRRKISISLARQILAE